MFSSYLRAVELDLTDKITEMERDVVYYQQINPFVFPIAILSCLKKLPKLRQNACKAQNIVNKMEQ